MLRTLDQGRRICTYHLGIVFSLLIIANYSLLHSLTTHRPNFILSKPIFVEIRTNGQGQQLLMRRIGWFREMYKSSRIQRLTELNLVDSSQEDTVSTSSITSERRQSSQIVNRFGPGNSLENMLGTNQTKRLYETLIESIQLKNPVRMSTLHAVIDEMISHGMHYECLHFIDLSCKYGYRLDEFRFHNLLKSCKTVKQVRELIRGLERAGVVINTIGYTLILISLERHNRLKDILDVMDFMRISGYPPNEVSYGVAINAASKLQDGAVAINLLREMRLYKIIPSNPCFGGALMACAKGDMWEEVEMILQEMVEDNCQISEGVLVGLLSQIKFKTMLMRSNLLAAKSTSQSTVVAQVQEELHMHWQIAMNLVKTYVPFAFNITDYTFVTAMEIADICENRIDILNLYDTMFAQNITAGKISRRWIEQVCYSEKQHRKAIRILQDPTFNDPRYLFLNMTLHLCSEVKDYYQTLHLIHRRLDILRRTQESLYYQRWSGSEFILFADAIDSLTSQHHELLVPEFPTEEVFTMLQEDLWKAENYVYRTEVAKALDQPDLPHLLSSALLLEPLPILGGNTTVDDILHTMFHFEEMELGNDMTENSQLLLMKIAIETNRWSSIRRMLERFVNRDYTNLMDFNRTRLFDMAAQFAYHHRHTSEYFRFTLFQLELLCRNGDYALAQNIFLRSIERFRDCSRWIAEDVPLLVVSSPNAIIAPSLSSLSVSTPFYNNNNSFQNNNAKFSTKSNSTYSFPPSFKDANHPSQKNAFVWYFQAASRCFRPIPLPIQAYRIAALGFAQAGYPGYALSLRDVAHHHHVKDIVLDRLITLAFARSPRYYSVAFELIAHYATINQDPMLYIIGIFACLHDAKPTNISNINSNTSTVGNAMTTSNQNFTTAYERALFYLKNIAALGHPLTTEIMTMTIDVCARCNRPEEAFKLLRTMEKFRIPRSNHTQHLVVEVLAKAELWNDVMYVLQGTVDDHKNFPRIDWLKSMETELAWMMWEKEQERLKAETEGTKNNHDKSINGNTIIDSTDDSDNVVDDSRMEEEETGSEEEEEFDLEAFIKSNQEWIEESGMTEALVREGYKAVQEQVSLTKASGFSKKKQDKIKNARNDHASTNNNISSNSDSAIGETNTDNNPSTPRSHKNANKGGSSSAVTSISMLPPARGFGKQYAAVSSSMYEQQERVKKQTKQGKKIANTESNNNNNNNNIIADVNESESSSTPTRSTNTRIGFSSKISDDAEKARRLLANSLPASSKHLLSATSSSNHSRNSNVNGTVYDFLFPTNTNTAATATADSSTASSASPSSSSLRSLQEWDAEIYQLMTSASRMQHTKQMKQDELVSVSSSFSTSSKKKKSTTRPQWTQNNLHDDYVHNIADRCKLNVRTGKVEEKVYYESVIDSLHAEGFHDIAQMLEASYTILGIINTSIFLRNCSDDDENEVDGDENSSPAGSKSHGSSSGGKSKDKVAIMNELIDGRGAMSVVNSMVGILQEKSRAEYRARKETNEIFGTTPKKSRT